MESAALDETPSEVALLAQPELPRLVGDEGIVFSAFRRQLLIFGGTDTGTPNGQPNQTAWLFDIDTGSSTQLDVGGGAGPGHVLAATSLFTDQAFYVVDIVEGSPELRRWTPNGTIEALARFPAEYASFAKHWIVAGPYGDLTYVGTDPPEGSTLPNAVIQRFVMSGGASSGGSANLRTSVLVAPLPTHEACTLVIPDAVESAVLSIWTPSGRGGSAPQGMASPAEGDPTEALPEDLIIFF